MSNEHDPGSGDRLRELLAPPSPQATRVDPALTRRVMARARRKTRRRRMAVAVGVPVLVAAVTAGVIVVTTQETTSNHPPVVQHPDRSQRHDEDTDRGATSGITDWLEHRKDAGSGQFLPASPGTAMYRTCDGDDCRVRLLAPSGEELDLAALRPDLAAELERVGLEGVSVSPDGTMVGYSDSGTYEVHVLDDRSLDVGVPLPDDGEQWRLIGWGGAYDTPVLGLYDGDRIVRYAHWQWSLTSMPTYTEVPDGVTSVPELGLWSGDTVGLAAVANGALWPSTDGRVATTTPPTNEWMTLGGRAKYAKVTDRAGWGMGRNGQSFESCVGPSETLVGGDGYLHRWTLGGTIPSQVDRLVTSTGIYDHAVSATEPVALAVFGCESLAPEDRWEPNSPPGGRMDLPTGDDPDRWTFLGVLANGEAALVDTAGDTCTYVRMDQNGGLHPMHPIPKGAEVIIPGGVPPA